jgi:cysteine synthase
MPIGLEREIVDQHFYDQAVARLRDARVHLPKLSELAEPATLQESYRRSLADVGPDEPDARNLYRVHWHNAADRHGFADTPEHVSLPKSLTGVDARIVVALGNRFPMVRCHKVLAAYGCLVPRLVTGQFDPSRQRAVWPSTGNYCRGGVAISRILGCRSVAVLPEGMSHELAEDPDNVIFNQFNEFGNYIIHRAVTGPAMERVFHAVNSAKNLICRAYVSASGSAGTLAAGDYLKERLGSAVCVVEALECPTLLYNGYGEHNIQGIGDKHVPYIHNVMNTDYAIGVSDQASDALNLLFNTTTGRDVLGSRRRIDQQMLGSLADLGISSIANVLAAIKLAKYLDLGSDDVILTVATDGAEMYGTELAKAQEKYFAGGFDELAAAETIGRFLLGAATDHVLELDRRDRERMFNLGYYTWVEQQGVSVAEFDARRSPSFWDDLMEMVPIWDAAIDEWSGHCTGTCRCREAQGKDCIPLEATGVIAFLDGTVSFAGRAAPYRP